MPLNVIKIFLIFLDAEKHQGDFFFRRSPAIFFLYNFLELSNIFKKIVVFCVDLYTLNFIRYINIREYKNKKIG